MLSQRSSTLRGYIVRRQLQYNSRLMHYGQFVVVDCDVRDGVRTFALLCGLGVRLTLMCACGKQRIWAALLAARLTKVRSAYSCQVSPTPCVLLADVLC